MWMIPFTRGASHTLQVDLGRELPVAGLRFWNYNKGGGSGEELLRGVRLISFSVDGQTLGSWELVSG